MTQELFVAEEAATLCLSREWLILALSTQAAKIWALPTPDLSCSNRLWCQTLAGSYGRRFQVKNFAQRDAVFCFFTIVGAAYDLGHQLRCPGPGWELEVLHLRLQGSCLPRAACSNSLLWCA